MERIELYRKIHKAQRTWLSACLCAAGRVDTGDDDGFFASRAEARGVVAHLRAHGEHEERFIHPLLAEAAPELARELDAEHAALEASLSAVESAADATALYDALAALASVYFAHLQLEEQRAMPALWAHCDDGTLIARILQPFVASRSASDILADLRLQLVAITRSESSALLGAMLR